MITEFRALGTRHGSLRHLLKAAADQISVWRFRARSRAVLGTLDDRMLRDLGLDQATAAEESARPFWR
jgi:uncharacterized protein YjiS (DUF1127 family)